MKPVMALLRQAGVRCLIYLDDLLIMGQSREEVGNVTQKILFLLQQLGFRVNWEKSQLTPSQRANYLGFILCSQTMIISLPEEKIKKIMESCYVLLKKRKASVREISGLIGRMSAAILAILPAPLCYRGLQRLKNETFASSQSYETIVSLDERAVEELIWWTQQVQHWNGRPILTPTPDITVETDASLLGWGAVSGETRTGGLWSEEERAQHINMLELMGGDFAAKIFAKDKQDIHIHLRMDNTTAIAYINHMGGTKSHMQSVTSSLQFVAVVPPEGDHLIGRALTRDVQHSGRCGISYDPHNRVDAGQISVQQCVTTMGLMLDRPVRFQVEQPVAEIRELAPRSLCSSNRCFSDILAGRTRICLPPFLFGRQMPHEGTTRRMYNSPDCPNMEHPAVVPSPTGAAHRLSITSAVTQDALTGSIQQAPPNDVEEPASASRLETVRASHSAGGISTRASALITSGWSKGTNVTYQSGWNRWHRWCDERDINPLSCDIKFFLDFLAELFDQGLQHRSINTIRSAVSMTHSQLEGVPIGQHPLVTRLLKGVYNLRPPMPRYSSTWDVGMVTKYLTSLGRNEDLPLKRLSQKLALLMALVEACRTSELKALDLRFKVLKPEGISFKLASLTKKRTPGLPPKELFFGAFPGNECLCVVKCLSAYESATAELRAVDGGVNQLFISYTRPHRPITSQRIAHWIKDLLGDAGVNTDVFKAHSVRGASTSAAMNKGVSLAEVLNTADWSKESTFRRFYYRSVDSTEYVSGVLGDPQ